MKVFWFSVAAFLLMIALIVANCLWVNQITAHMENALQELSKAPTLREVEALIDYWQARETALGISIPANELEDVSEHLVTLRTSFALHDEKDFERSRALCLESVLRIQRLERFSLIYIL